MPPSRRLDRFSRIIQLRTVSRQPGQPADIGPFKEMAALLRELFPSVHRSFRRETVAEASLLYTLDGSDESLEPVMLTAHLDVVPAEAGEGWPHPPFSGAVADGRIWGRGTIDYKLGVSGMLEACEELMEEGFRPSRTIILAFGHDEETGGDSGAAGIVEVLRKRSVRLRSVLDEGGYIYSYPWLDGDVAVVGLAEKGYLTLRLTAAGEQGHASVPPTVTAAGRLCRALARLEDRQMEPLLCEPVRMMLERTAHMFRDRDKKTYSPPEMMAELEKYPAGNALVRTTTAITMLKGSDKENVLPGRPRALVNFRAVPGDHSSSIMSHVRETVRDLDITVEFEDDRHIHQPSVVSSAATPEYRAIKDALKESWPGTPVVPGIFPAATDSRHYCSLADNVYRFQPVHLGARGLSALHSRGESISTGDYRRAVTFYREYVRRVCSA
ncbi:MAG: M20/M25/M40 family metallo-hydrolase [Candidatus Aegiribacteria sp.]